MSTPFALLETPLTPGVTLLEASAGTGKTYALAALVLRLIGEENVPIGRIVVTTYTIPATAELSDRIRARLAETLDTFDGKPHAKPTPFIIEFVARHSASPIVRKRVADALRDFDQAVISTIHGFCHRMIQDRAFETGTKPALELVPDETSLVRETAEDFWRRNFSAQQPALTPIAMLENLTPANLARLLSNNANHPLALIRPAAADIAASTDSVTKLLAEFRASWPAWREPIRKMFITDADWAIGNWGKTEFIQPQFDLVEMLATAESSPLSAYRALQSFRPSAIERGKGISKRRPMPQHAFTTWCETFAAACKTYAATMRSAFLDWSRAELSAKKAKLGIVAFSDLLAIFHAALHQPGSDALVAAIRDRYSVALVDEFQDTDPIQTGIFQRLFGELPQRLFLIGDPKQAIYGFRGADLFTYLRVTDGASRKFRLDTNHRSDAPLVDSVNTLFSRPTSPFIDTRVPFNPVLAGHSTNDRPLSISGEVRAPMRFWFWESEKPVTSELANSSLPHVVASELVRMLDTAKLADGKLLPRDCAILCAKNSQCQDMQAALAERGIPSVVLSNASVFESDEAREIYIVASALATPAREPAIRAALATRIMGFDAAALDRVATNAPEWETILARFHAYHVRWRDGGFIQMFRELIQAEHLRPRILAQPQGDRRLTNLLHLAELLHQTSHEFQLGPGGLLRWLAAQIDNPGSGDERELRLERDDDAVKILTIHKSKGLEWPVVFCPFLWTKADLHKHQDPLFHDAQDRAILDLGSPMHGEAAIRAAHEQLAERLRLLYVALTRARHECHVVWGTFRDSENSGLMWLLESPGDGGTDAPAALRAHAESLTSQMLHNTIQHLAGEAPLQFSATELPEVSDVKYTPKQIESTVGSPRTFAGHIDRSWRVSSFTAYTALRETEEADYDRDQRPISPSERRGIHAFPGGMKVGVCLHDIFENLDFTRPSTIHGLVEAKLKLHGLHSIDHMLSVIQTVRKVLDAPLFIARAPKRTKRDEGLLELPLGINTSGLKLGAVALDRTLRELEFHLPTGPIHAGELAEFTGAGLSFEPRRGVLKGFIDLIFEHEGRFHIVDWKSNVLGTSSESYTASAMWSEIVSHRYDLQWQLYLLALHRYLRLRLANYDPAKHLGTVFYVFLRGVEPFQQHLGIHRAEPNLAALAKLDALFLKP